MKQLAGLLCAMLALSPLSHADLASDVRSVLADKLLAKATVGIQIVRVGSTAAQAQVLFDRDSRRPLIPASNMKILSTSAALATLGPDFRFRTVLARRGSDLILVGDGDPSFGDAELLRKHKWTTITVFAEWAAQLKKAGLTRFRDVRVDDSVFDDVFVHPHWPSAQQPSPYVAQVAGMSLNTNCIDFYVHNLGPGQTVRFTTDPPTQYLTVRNSCVGGSANAVWLTRQLGGNQLILKGSAKSKSQGPFSVTVHDPPMYAATVLSETLKAGGITIDGRVLRDRSIRTRILGDAPDPSLTVLAVHETPISTVLARANKDSINLYAECLCKRLGYAVTGESGSWQNGTAAIASFLQRIGVPQDQFRLEDGSGLARLNAVSPHAIVRVLLHNSEGKNQSHFLASLAAGGQEGTLHKRFAAPAFPGRVFAKTGYIANVSALSGYVQTAKHWYAFSILMNDLPAGSNSDAKTLQDRIVKAIAAQDQNNKP